MRLEVIQTFDQFLNLRNDWNLLLQSSSSNGVFLTHEWMSTWWKHLAEGRKLHLVTARQGDRLIGVLPLAERRPQVARMMPRMLEFIASGVIGSDYLDVIADRAYKSAVVRAFADHLDRTGMLLQFAQLRGGDCEAINVADWLRHRSWTIVQAKLNVCPFIDLRGQTWESYLATLGPNVRKNINRYLRNLPKNFDTRYECISSPGESDDALGILIDLHKKRWASRLSDAFQSEAVIAFHRDFVQQAAERDWLRLIILRLDGRPAAALYGLHYGSTFYFYQSGFDPEYSKHSVGVATMAVAIRTAIEGGALEYDFLHGDEEYKFHWAHGARDLTRLEMHPPEATAWLYRHAIGFNRAARQMARRVLKTARTNAAVNR